MRVVRSVSAGAEGSRRWAPHFMPLAAPPSSRRARRPGEPDRSWARVPLIALRSIRLPGEGCQEPEAEELRHPGGADFR